MLQVIELPIKHPELFESLGVAQPKASWLPHTAKCLLLLTMLLMHRVCRAQSPSTWMLHSVSTAQAPFTSEGKLGSAGVVVVGGS